EREQVPRRMNATELELGLVAQRLEGRGRHARDGHAGRGGAERGHRLDADDAEPLDLVAPDPCDANEVIVVLPLSLAALLEVVGPRGSALEKVREPAPAVGGEATLVDDVVLGGADRVLGYARGALEVAVVEMDLEDRAAIVAELAQVARLVLLALRLDEVCLPV